MGEIRIKRDVSDAIVYGIHIDPNIQDPSNAVTYLEDAVGMTPASMGSTAFNFGSWENVFFMPKPCMVRYDGTVDYYLDPNDYTKKADGTPSDIGNLAYQGNAMMEWGLLWFKFWSGSEEGEGYFCIADRKVDDTYDCTCNYDADGNITEHFYTAIYQGTTAPNYDSTKTYAVDDIVTYSDVEYKCITAVETAEAFDGTKWTQLSETTRLRSLSGVQLIPANGNGNTTGTQEVARATACNTTAKTEWYIETWCDRVLINALLVLIGKSLDTQGTFGRGIDSGAQARKEAYVTGALNDKGLFYGSTANGTTAVKTFGMENWWALAWHRTAGLIGGANDTYLYKMTWSTHDGSAATGYNSNGSGYLSTSGRPADNYLYKAKYDKWGFLPIVTGNSNTLYYKDYFFNGTKFALCGGSSNGGASGGAFTISLSAAFGSTNWHLTAAPSFKPRAKVPYNPDWDNRPAHQFINGEWIDIPTHHFINGRWQGELTTQSPLKFRADGEMLDWRVEGRTSGNLFDTSVYNNDTYRHNCTVTNTSNSVTITSTGTDPYSGDVFTTGTAIPAVARTMYMSVKPNTAYTIAMSSAPKCYITQIDAEHNSVSGYRITQNLFTFTTNSATRYIIIRLGDDTLQVGESRTFENIQLLEGTYTASTLPPYEPYGGVGVRTENLFDKDATEDAYIDVEGNIHSSTTTKTSNYIPVLENTSYTLYMNGDTSSTNLTAIVFFDLNKDLLSYTTYVPEQGSQSIPINTPASASYVRFSVNNLRENVMLTLGSTAPDHYIPYGYKIPVRVEGENLFDVVNYEQYARHNNCVTTTNGIDITITATSANDPYLNPALNAGSVVPDDQRRNSLFPCKPNTTYTFFREDTDSIYTGLSMVDKDFNSISLELFGNNIKTFTTTEDTKYLYMRLGNASSLPVDTPVTIKQPRIIEGTYTASTIPPYEVSIFTDHQLMDGDSIDYTITETTIPLATGNNTLTVDTAVKPKSVFVKFEG